MVSDVGENEIFFVMVTGTIESAVFHLGSECSQVFCRFEVVAGESWDLLSGLSHGVSQAVMPNYSNDKIVFNMPFECTYRSSSLYGWPRMLVSVYGKNCFSVETTLGYAWCNMPVIGSKIEKVTEPLRIPKESTVLAGLSTWITSRNAELKNPKILLDACEGQETLSMETHGEVCLHLQSICKGVQDIFPEPNLENSQSMLKT